jgi:hypothetical protein
VLLLTALLLLLFASCSSSSGSSRLQFSEPRVVFYNASCGANSSCANTPMVPHFCWADPAAGWASSGSAPRHHLWCNLGADPGSPYGTNGYEFSSDSGRTWRVVREARNLLGSTLLVDNSTGVDIAYRSDGDDTKAHVTKYGWTQPNPLHFVSTADGLSVTEPGGGPVRFFGIPEPGMAPFDPTIEQSQPKTSGNIAVRLADGSYLRAANIVWAGTPTSRSSSNTTTYAVSVVIFASTDAMSWEYVGCAINGE